MVLPSTFLPKDIQFGLQISAPKGTAMLVHSLAMKSRKRFAHIVSDTFAKHSDLVQDSRATSGSTQGRVFATFDD